MGRGSINPPAMLQLDFNPTNDPNAPVLACLVGKGITFDSGGYSIKPSDGMSTMRTDMGGGIVNRRIRICHCARFKSTCKTLSMLCGKLGER